MRKSYPLFALILFFASPILFALTNEEQEGRKEIEQQWVDRHNEKLDGPVKAEIKKVWAKQNAFVMPTLHPHRVPLRRLSLATAGKWGIPLEVPGRDKSTVPLAAFYQAKLKFTDVGDHAFFIADYSDEMDPLHSSADIYMKVGLRYVKFFHGEGYGGCARIISLDHTGKDAPIFFEIGTYGGGSRVDRTLYALKKEAVKAMPDDLYDHPENVKPEDYYELELKLSVWLEGLTSYKDLAKDGTFEIVNFSKVGYPDELRKKLEAKYGLEDNDFKDPFRRAVSIYKWNNDKSKFDDAGDFYY